MRSEYSATERSAHVRIGNNVPAETEPYATDIGDAPAPFGKGAVSILDTTLRDGEQTPGISLTEGQKMDIARMLDDLGVNTIEAGFPITSAGEQKAVSMIASSELDAKVTCLARAEIRDIEKAIDCGVGGIHIFISSSDIHLRDQLRISREEMMKKAVDAVEFAKAHGLEIEFSAMDATRTDTSHLIEVARAVRGAGATMFDIADTVGICTPERMKALVRAIVATGIDVSVHCHNDFGLAVANSISAVEAGAKQVHTTLIGIGERAGNTSLEEFVMAAQRLYGFSTGIRIGRLAEACNFVSEITGFPISVNKPIVGTNAFGHKSGIHTQGIMENPLTYEPFDPGIVGRGRWMQAGKHSGRHGIAAQLNALNISLGPKELGWVVRKVKERGDNGSITSTDELVQLAQAARQTVTGEIAMHDGGV